MTDILDPDEDAPVPPYGLGAFPSTPDARDWQLELDAALALPVRYVANGMGPVLNQGTSPMCVAYAHVGLKQWEEKRDRHGVVSFDPVWLYDHCKTLDGNDVPGTTGRQALRLLKGTGLAVVGGKTPSASWKIAGYWAVPVTVDALKRAIYQYGPLTVGGDWHWSWFRPLVGILPEPAGGIAGGHEVLLFGWDENIAGGSFVLRNSWGSKWGHSGNAWAPYQSYVPSLWEAWKAMDVKAA